MANYVWLVLTLTFGQVVTLQFPPRPPNAPNRSQWHPSNAPPSLRRAAYEARAVFNPPTLPKAPISGPYEPSIQRRGSPYLLIRPMNVNKRPKTSRRLVLTLPQDNIQILNAEAMPERGSQILPTTLTLSLRNTETDDREKDFTRYGASRTYAFHNHPHSPSRFHYGFMADSDEEEKPNGRWKGEVSYDLDDLEGSSGGHVTVIKGHPAPPPKFLTARKVKASRQSPMKAMKAIIIQPKEIQAKRVRVVETTAEKVSPSKGRYVKAGEPMLTTAMKAKVHPVSFKKAIVSKSKGEDWAASNVHYVNAEPPENVIPRHQDEGLSSMTDLQCGGSNDLGWCDLGANYPSAEVSQIMAVCDELLSRMYVEVPISSNSMEDIASYSLSRNVTQNAFWPWKESKNILKKSLCEVQKNVIQPSFAQDIRGKWHVIIQTDTFPQRIPLEVCSKPGEACSATELCNKSESQCVQKYSHHQLISFDPESAETCPYVRLYKFPTSCVCRLAE